MIPLRSTAPQVHTSQGVKAPFATGATSAPAEGLHQQIGSPAAKRWTNVIPAWISTSEDYKKLRAQVRATLQAIADRCSSPAADGSLVGAFGGQSLIELAGTSRTAFWRHLTRLESFRFVITIGRGGTFAGRNFGNIYGIPGFRGALDAREARRQMQRMVRGDDGKLRPQVLAPGEQPTIWPEPKKAPSRPPQSGTGVVPKWDGGSVEMGHHHSPVSIPCNKNHEKHGAHGAVGGGDSGQSFAPERIVRKAKPIQGAKRCPHIEPDDFADTARLLDLWRACYERGLAFGSDGGRLQFVALAMHALRIGDNPAKLLASLINRQQWFFITHSDEEDAARRLRDHMFGETPRREDWRAEYDD